MLETRAIIVSVEELSEQYCKLKCATGWSSWTPGQFVMVRTPGGSVFVRRPFGIVDITDGVLEICFKVVGPGTAALSRVKQGDELDVVGPLGNGFKPVADAVQVMVAGGYGIVPLVGLARLSARAGHSVVFVYGARTSRDLIYLDELEKLPLGLHVATEDGSRGEKGTIVDPLTRVLTANDRAAVYAVGPQMMMKAAADIAAQHGMPAYVSLDEYMACGIGVCLGCMCETNDGGHVRVCREGPVFDATKISYQLSAISPKIIKVNLPENEGST